ncbi:hypothetical protein D3Y57_02695 (plasmid) [Sphingomonas paeninsulae]|uniref:Uncharacterized protein n=1 Tax=Sphingomonas paeninsulae TaxID=2319844 RepID=A0A494TGN6_SPHPE|nr:hypothetical protein [Sphingomonas paeninsulae]AYJ84981.1 hypothetical protein D3Y57_02695 [Sphingomonas paeninsulae]
MADYPTTPDGRYFVVRGGLWRKSSPLLSEARRLELVGELMTARRAVGVAGKDGNPEAVALARKDVDCAKRALGERGPVRWTDGAPDLNRRMAVNTIYADWYTALSSED